MLPRTLGRKPKFVLRQDLHGLHIGQQWSSDISLNSGLQSSRGQRTFWQWVSDSEVQRHSVHLSSNGKNTSLLSATVLLTRHPSQAGQHCPGISIGFSQLIGQSVVCVIINVFCEKKSMFNILPIASNITESLIISLFLTAIYYQVLEI